MAALTPVPGSPPWHLGLLDLRGQLLAVVDLRARLGLPEAAATLASRVVVVRSGGRSAGLVVDAVEGELTAALPSLERSGDEAHLATPARDEAGVLLLLDVDALLADAEESGHGG